MTTIIIGCNKGGSSKSTTACNLAVALAMTEADVCLVDADRQRSAARWHADRESAAILPGITLVEKYDNIASTLKSLEGRFDYVIVDVAGRNSRELITGAAVADVIVAPHQCSQLDLDTMYELQDQVVRIRDLNPKLKVLAYHTMASTNPVVRDAERQMFVEYLSDLPDIACLESVSYYRKVYKDAMALGKSVLECDNPAAANEVRSLVEELFA